MPTIDPLAALRATFPEGAMRSALGRAFANAARLVATAPEPLPAPSPAPWSPAPKARRSPQRHGRMVHRAYMPGPTAYRGRAGSKTYRQVTTVLAHRHTREATIACAPFMALTVTDWNWMADKGYITFEGAL